MQCTPDWLPWVWATWSSPHQRPGTHNLLHRSVVWSNGYLRYCLEFLGVEVVSPLLSWVPGSEVHNMTTTSLTHKIPTPAVVEPKSIKSAWWDRLYCTAATQKEMSSHSLDQYMMQSQLRYAITFSETTIIRWNVTLYASTLGKAPI